MLKRIRHKVSRFWASAALMSVEMAISLVLFSASLATFVYLVRKVFVHERTGFDEQAFKTIGKMVSPGTTSVMQTFSFLGSHNVLIPVNVALIAYFLLRKHKWYSTRVPSVAISSLVIMLLLKQLFARPRPEIPLLEAARGLSFPSGHALTAVTFFGLMIYIAWRSARNNTLKVGLISLFIIMILGIGVSRVYLRVHYASDVLAGYCLGFLWLFISLTVIRRLEMYSKRELTPVVEDKPVGVIPSEEERSAE
ncbi:MAG TPA: phosphatase PAP2 family protein [Flavipsychrobacter sp.]|nr:phosphatase PAP2 family protein [Flavipsychrobacter sp.]